MCHYGGFLPSLSPIQLRSGQALWPRVLARDRLEAATLPLYIIPPLKLIGQKQGARFKVVTKDGAKFRTHHWMPDQVRHDKEVIPFAFGERDATHR